MSVFIPIPKKDNAKGCSSYHKIVFISHASKVLLKILQASLQQYVNWELPHIQVALRKGRGTEIKLPTFIGSWRAKEFRKNINFCFIDYTKGFDWRITTNCGKFLKRWEYHITLPVSWETRIQVKTWNTQLVQNWKRSLLSSYLFSLYVEYII